MTLTENSLSGRRTRWDHGFGVSTSRGNCKGKSWRLQSADPEGGCVFFASDGRLRKGPEKMLAPPKRGVSHRCTNEPPLASPVTWLREAR